MKKTALAAIDLGTNSCRLLIVGPDGKTLYKNAIATRLGEGMSAHNRFTDEAVKRGIECFCTFKMNMDEYGVEKYRAIATAACRMAGNGPEFVKKIKQHAGIDLEIIDGYEEAVLNLKGALLNVRQESAGHVVVYDLGGGSTEITLASRGSVPKILHTVSIPWGARNASEKFGLREYNKSHADRLAEEISAYSRRFAAEAELEKYRDDLCFVATSSTPLRLTHIARGWESYNRSRADGVKMSIEEFEGAVAKVHGMTCAEMAEDLNIGPVRAEIFQAGCVIFSQIYRDLGAPHLISSLKSAVDGIIMELQNEQRYHGVTKWLKPNQQKV